MSLMIEGGRRLPEYSRGVKAASGLVVAGLFVSSCRADVRGTPTAEIFTDEPRATETLSPTPEPDRAPGVSLPESQLIAVGRSIGAGGEGSVEPPVYINNNLQSKLINSGLRPIIDSERGNLLTQTLVSADGQRVCFPNVPDVLYNPELGQDDHVRDESFLRLYGNKQRGEVRFKAVTAVSLNGFAKDIVCVNSIAAAGRNNIFNVSPGTVVTVLMNKDTSEIYGGFNSVYAQSDNVVFDQATARITVNGRDVWFEGPGMAELASTPSPTSTPEPAATPEGYLAPEKIQELVSSFVCNEESCVRDVYRYPNQLYFDFISSGVFQEINLANPKSGELLGRGMVLKAVSKDKNDRPFVVNILVQLEPVDNPGYNYLYGAAWTLIVAGNQEMDFVGEETLSADEWSRFIPEGETYEIVLLKRRAPDSDRISSDPTTRDLYYLFYDDPNYLEMLKAFYESNGEEVNENLILFISGSTDNTPKIVTTP